jgi:hypothetical protein
MWNVADAARGCMVFVGRVFAVRDGAYPRLCPIDADNCGGASYANGAVHDTIVAADGYSLGDI